MTILYANLFLSIATIRSNVSITKLFSDIIFFQKGDDIGNEIAFSLAPPFKGCPTNLMSPFKLTSRSGIILIFSYLLSFFRKLTIS